MREKKFLKKLRELRERTENFAANGITLLLVVVLLAALLSISIGVFNVVFREYLISGETGDSAVAFYAADQGIDKTLYRARISQDVCAGGDGTGCYTETKTLPSGACYDVSVDRAQDNVIITSRGWYRCGQNELRVVQRGFKVAYALPQPSPPPPSFDYELSNSGGITVNQGSQGSNTITATLVSGAPSPVTLSVSGLPQGASASLDNNPCAPTCQNNLTIAAAASTPLGTYPITATGDPLGKTTSFNLIVNPSPPAGVFVTAYYKPSAAGCVSSCYYAFYSNGNYSRGNAPTDFGTIQGQFTVASGHNFTDVLAATKQTGGQVYAIYNDGHYNNANTDADFGAGAHSGPISYTGGHAASDVMAMFKESGFLGYYYYLYNDGDYSAGTPPGDSANRISHRAGVSLPAGYSANQIMASFWNYDTETHYTYYNDGCFSTSVNERDQLLGNSIAGCGVALPNGYAFQ